VDLDEPRSKLVGPDAWIRFPEPDMPLLPIAEVAPPRHASSLPPQPLRSTLGEQPPSPAPARVSDLFAHGRKKKMAHGRRSPLDPTVRPSTYRFGPCCRWQLGPVRQGEPAPSPPRAALLEMGRPGAVSPGSVQIWPVGLFFLAVLYYFL
jgi:hypothetical protein